MLPKMGVGVGVGAGINAGLIILLSVLAGVNSYSKFGRGCSDIGCMPNEECIISTASCSYNQRDGESCGNYPTCKRKSDAGAESTPGHVNPSGNTYKSGADNNNNNIFSPASSNPTLNSHNYNTHNGNAADGQPSSSGGFKTYNNNNNNNNGLGSVNNGYTQQTNNANPHNMGINNGGSDGNPSHNNNNNNNNNKNNNNNLHSGQTNPAIVDPHYVFGAPQSAPVLPNLPIFPYNAPTSAPSFQQFPQPNHPGSVLSPSFPGGLQPVNPYNPPFVFGQQPYYTAPGGTGGPPGGINGILGGSGGGLAPHSYYNGYQNPTYQNPNMYNKPPPQYQNQNQNPYNRQTQTYPSAAVSLISSLMTVGCAVVSLFLLNFP